MSIGSHGDTLFIFDAGNGRIVTWKTDGAPLGVTPTEASVYANSASLDRAGFLVPATGGFTGELISLVRPDGHRMGGFGKPIPLPPHFAPSDVRDELRMGQVPALFRNNAIATRSPKGAVFVAMMATPEVTRFASDGRVSWRIRLVDPVHEELPELYTELNLDESDPRVVHPFRFFSDIQAGDTTLWLLGPPEASPTVLWELSGATGAVLRRCEFSGPNGISAFAVDPRRAASSSPMKTAHGSSARRSPRRARLPRMPSDCYPAHDATAGVRGCGPRARTGTRGIRGSAQRAGAARPGSAPR